VRRCKGFPINKGEFHASSVLDTDLLFNGIAIPKEASHEWLIPSKKIP
jgi:hypothetical protein